MENFRCEFLEGKIILKGPCPYQRGKIEKGNATCQKCLYYKSVIFPNERKKPGQVTWTLETFIKDIGLQAWEEIKTKPHGQYCLDPQYCIDPKLKANKDFPEDLAKLLKVFNDEIPFCRMEVKWNHLTELEPYLEELNSLEKTFMDFYLQPSIAMIVKCRSIMRAKIRSYPEAFPHLYDYWNFLEKVVDDKRVRGLFHQCLLCKKIFFLKEKKRKKVFDTPDCGREFRRQRLTREGYFAAKMREHRKKQ